MLTPAQEHFLRVTAEQESKATKPEDTMAGATGYELMLAKLAEDRRRLKSVESIERKIELKRELLPQYAAYIDGALAGGNGAQDDVLTTLMVWGLDCAEYEQALRIAGYAIVNGMTLPDQYQRKLVCTVGEEVADTELKKYAAGKPLNGTALADTIALTVDHDMPDQVRAKLHKALAYALRDGDPAQPQDALDHLRRAFALDDKAGVKKDIERLERDIKNAPAAQEPTAPVGKADEAGGDTDKSATTA